jgi:hypothetical protein
MHPHRKIKGVHEPVTPLEFRAVKDKLHCATSRKVAGSIPDGVTELFQWLNPSGRTVALGTNLSLGGGGVKGGRCVGLTILPPSSADCLEILGASTSWNPKGLSRACSGKALPKINNHNTYVTCDRDSARVVVATLRAGRQRTPFCILSKDKNISFLQKYLYCVWGLLVLLYSQHLGRFLGA